MKNRFSYFMPTQIIFGQDEFKRIHEFVARRKTVLITSQGSLCRGLLNRLTTISENIVFIFPEINSHPTLLDLKKAYSEIHQRDFELILAVGGGSVIDAAKFISVFNEAKEPEFVARLARGQSDVRISHKRIPIISIPTTAGTSSEITPWATIWDTAEKKKYSLQLPDLFCETAIYDPVLTLTVPRNITIQTGLDTLSHALESIWNKNGNDLTIGNALTSIRIVMDVLPRLSDDLENIEMRERMLKATLFAGLAFSNTQTAIAHAISYFLTLEKGIPHGIACSITLPSILARFVEQGGKMADNLRAIFGMNPRSALEAFFERLQVSLKLEDYGIQASEFEEMKVRAKALQRSSNSLVWL